MTWIYEPCFQDLKEEIESRLARVNNIRYEPRLLSPDDDRLKHRGQIGERVKHLT